MNLLTPRVAVAACLVAASTAGAEPFRIVATDGGLEAPASMPAGLRHIVFENRGTRIHEAMQVRLPIGMNAEGFRAKVEAGVLFPEGAEDYSGPGLMSGGEVTEVWPPAW